MSIILFMVLTSTLIKLTTTQHRTLKDGQVEAKENLINHISVVTESSALDYIFRTQLMAIPCAFSFRNFWWCPDICLFPLL